MSNVSAERLPFLRAIPSDASSGSRRSALARSVAARRVAVARTVGSAAIAAYFAMHAAFYGMFSAFGWSRHGHPAFGAILSVISAGMILVTAGCLRTFREHRDRIPVVPDALRREAAAEAELERAVEETNRAARNWNDAAALAIEAQVCRTFVDALVLQRLGIELRQLEIMRHRTRLAMLSLKVREVPPARAWATTERVGLSATDS